MLRLIGVGNRWRGDDAVGLVVAERVMARQPAGVEVVEHDGEPIELIDACRGASAVWLVDAVRSGAPPGTLHHFDVSERELPVALFRASTHRLGLADALELSRALGRLPASVVVFAIEGANFDAGQRLSPPVALAADQLVDLLVERVAALAGRC